MKITHIELAKISSIADPNAAVYVAWDLSQVQKVCAMLGTRDTVWSQKQIDTIGDRAGKGEFNMHVAGHTVTISLKGDAPEPVAFTSTEMTEIFEITRVALANGDLFDHMADKLDLSDEYMGALRDKVIAYTDSEETPLTVADYEEVLADHRRLVRQMDVAINGEQGAAKQASLCDIVSQVCDRRFPLLRHWERTAEPAEQFVVCEIICQKPSVSVHATEAAALDHAVECAMENTHNPDHDKADSRTCFRETLGQYEHITEGDYEVYILTPTN